MKQYNVKVGDAFISIKASRFLYKHIFIVTEVNRDRVTYNYVSGSNVVLNPYDKSIEFFTDEWLEPVPSLIKELL
jgi:hypothetical protein